MLPSTHLQFSLLMPLLLQPQLLLATSRHHLQPPPPPCSDYEMLIVNTDHCVARCPIRCINNACFEDGVCPCEGSYVKQSLVAPFNRKSKYYVSTFDKQSLVCAANCLPGCKSAGGFCAAPDLCLCSRPGYYFNAILRRCRKYHVFSDRCFGRCLYGKCTANGRCLCAQGYEYRETLLGQLCVPICKQNCGPHGYCHLPNMCACRKKHYHYEWDGRCHKDYIDLK